MKKKPIVFLITIAVVISFVGFAGSSLVAKAADKTSRPIVGVVTGINGTTLTVVTRNNATYSVDADNADVVTGFLGFWAKPSSFSNIQVTDTLTVKGDVSGSSIIAIDIADNKTPSNALSEESLKPSPTDATSTQTNSDTQNLNEQASSTNSDASSTILDTLQGIVNNVVAGVFSGTSIGTSTTVDVTSTSTNYTDSNQQADASTTATTTSIVDTVINTISNTVQSVVNAVTGGASTTDSTNSSDASASSTDQ